MDEYQNLWEKSKYFISGGLKIERFDDLINTIDKVAEIDKDRGAIYRGQPESRFKLYNTLQRFWITNNLSNRYESYSILIENLVNRCMKWEKGIIPKYLENSNCENNKISCLSIMQHYGIPTPLLDFTTNIYKSLFFAIQNTSPPTTVDGIDNYSSIIYVYKKSPMLFSTDYFINRMLKLTDKEGNSVKKDLKTLSLFDTVLINDSDTEFLIRNNLNIINQEGSFIYSSSPTKPLEELNSSTIEIIKLIGSNHEVELNPPKEVGGCINFNKNLIPKIQTYLKSRGIDREHIFPDLNRLKVDVLEEELKNQSK